MDDIIEAFAFSPNANLSLRCNDKSFFHDEGTLFHCCVVYALQARRGLVKIIEVKMIAACGEVPNSRFKVQDASGAEVQNPRFKIQDGGWGGIQSGLIIWKWFRKKGRRWLIN